MITSNTCPVCGTANVVVQTIHDPFAKFYECQVCGRYKMRPDDRYNTELDLNKLRPFLYYKGFKQTPEFNEPKYYTTLSKEKCDEYNSRADDNNAYHGRPVHLDNDIINAWYPKSFSEKTDLILLKIGQCAEYIGHSVEMSEDEWLSCMFVHQYKDSRIGVKYSREEMIDQASFYSRWLNESGYTTGGISLAGKSIEPITITAKGYQRIDELQRKTNDGRDVLVAMKFGKDTRILRESIKTGICEAGYNPILIDEVEHNGLITPELLSQIRNSRFVVVDLTHQNNGAYFEEGYAMGVGKQVIQLCKEGTKLHFDISQINTIMWKTENEIPLRLKNRIIATIE